MAVTAAVGFGLSAPAQVGGRTPASAPASRASSQATSGPVRITILHVNDVHGQLEPRNVGGKSIGGYARLSTYADQLRKDPAAGHVLLVHCGDETSRGDDLTEKSQGAANMAILSALKLDAMTPGNGEFYAGHAPLDKLMKAADFPFLTANVKVRFTEDTLGKPYIIKNVGGARVAFFGLCFIRTQVPSALAFKIEDPVATAKELVPQLRKQADVVIAMTHIGYDDDVKLAKAVDGIDVIIGGHSHSVLEGGRRAKGPSGKEVLICQAGEHLKFCGRVDLEVAPDGRGYKLAKAQATLVPLDEKIKLDPAVTALIAKLSAASQPASAPATAR